MRRSQENHHTGALYIRVFSDMPAASRVDVSAGGGVAPHACRGDALSGHQARHRHSSARPPRLWQDFPREGDCRRVASFGIFFDRSARNCTANTSPSLPFCSRITACRTGARGCGGQREGSGSRSVAVLYMQARRCCVLTRCAVYAKARAAAPSVIFIDEGMALHLFMLLSAGLRNAHTAQAIFAGRNERGRAGQQLSAQ